MATDSQGSTFVFASATYTVTSVTVTPGGDLLDNSHLGLASGSNRTYQSPALIDDEVSVEAFGTATVAVGSSGSLASLSPPRTPPRSRRLAWPTRLASLSGSRSPLR
jgi:hypothetical protein